MFLIQTLVNKADAFTNRQMSSLKINLPPAEHNVTMFTSSSQNLSPSSLALATFSDVIGGKTLFLIMLLFLTFCGILLNAQLAKLYHLPIGVFIFDGNVNILNLANKVPQSPWYNYIVSKLVFLTDQCE